MTTLSFQEISTAILSEVQNAINHISNEDAKRLTDKIIKADKVYLDGKGRSGLQAKAFAMRLAHMRLAAFETSGVTTTAITANDLLIICSGSGETENLISHAKTAKKIGAKIFLITTSENSSIGQLADDMIVIPGDDKVRAEKLSCQPMGTLFEQSLEIFFDSVVLLVMNKLGIAEKEMHAMHNNLE